MIQFKPYPSIGNAADAAWMAQVRENVEIGTLFAVQEKVDGANVSFLCDDLEVRMARRTAILDPLEPFFGYQQVLERYSGHIYHIYNRLRLSYPEMTSIAVYGELFGGYGLVVASGRGRLLRLFFAVQLRLDGRAFRAVGRNAKQTEDEDGIQKDVDDDGDGAEGFAGSL